MKETDHKYLERRRRLLKRCTPMRNRIAHFFGFATQQDLMELRHDIVLLHKAHSKAGHVDRKANAAARRAKANGKR
jgi:hypothetical protein